MPCGAAEQYGGDQAPAAGLIATCPITEPDRAWKVQDVLTRRGQHHSAGAVDLVVAATAELQGLTLPHRDRDVRVHRRRPSAPVVRPPQPAD